LGRENISKPTTGSGKIRVINNDDGFRMVKYATLNCSYVHDVPAPKHSWIHLDPSWWEEW